MFSGLRSFLFATNESCNDDEPSSPPNDDPKNTLDDNKSEPEKQLTQSSKTTTTTTTTASTAENIDSSLKEKTDDKLVNAHYSHGSPDLESSKANEGTSLGSAQQANLEASSGYQLKPAEAQTDSSQELTSDWELLGFEEVVEAEEQRLSNDVEKELLTLKEFLETHQEDGVEEKQQLHQSTKSIEDEDMIQMVPLSSSSSFSSLETDTKDTNGAISNKLCKKQSSFKKRAQKIPVTSKSSGNKQKRQQKRSKKDSTSKETNSEVEKSPVKQQKLSTENEEKESKKNEDNGNKRAFSRKSKPSTSSDDGNNKIVDKDDDVKLIDHSTNSSGSEEFSTRLVIGMEESWFMTPPPCFTGTKVFKKNLSTPQKDDVTFLLPFKAIVKSKKAVNNNESDDSSNKSYSSTDFENMLIEHPSVYIENVRRNTIPEKVFAKPITGQLQQKTTGIPQPVPQAMSTARVSSHLQDSQPVDGPSCGGIWIVPKVVKVCANEPKESSFDEFDQRSSSIPVSDDSTAENIDNDVTETSNYADENDSSALDSSGKTESSDTSGSRGQQKAFVGNSEQKGRVKGTDPKAKQIVKSIKPERAPAWQLKKKRHNRKPLNTMNRSGSCTTVAVANASTSKSENKKSSNPTHKSKNNKRRNERVDQQQSSASGSSKQSVSRANSSPAGFRNNLIFERITSTLTSNLMNLTRTLNQQADRFENLIDSCDEQQQDSANNLAENVYVNSKFLKKNNKAVSPSYLSRNNKVVLKNNSVKRADRRTKMHTKFNGVSINRKVHTNFSNQRLIADQAQQD